MRKKLLRSRSGFEKPESREEAIMQNILGASNVLEPAESNIEEILQAILYNTPYTKEAESEIEKILLAIKNNGTYDGEGESRDMKILIAILNDLDYTEEAESRIEELYVEWLQQRKQIKVLEGIPPLSFTSKGKPLTAWSITGNTVQNGTPTPENPVEVLGCGERTANLATSISSENGWQIGYIYKPSGIYTSNNVYGEILSPKISISAFNSITISATPYSAPSMSLYFYNGDKYIPTNIDDKDYSGSTFSNFPKTATNFRFAIRTGYKSLDAVNAAGWVVMLNSGSTPLPYEPYGYKIPVVTRGKNLAGNYTVSSGYYYDDSGTPTPSDARFIRLIINVEPNTIYTISSNLKFYSIWEFNNNTKISRSGGGNSNKYTIKTTKECNSLRISMINTSGEADTSAFEWIQLEKGTTATPYEPYHEPITTPIYLPTPLYSGEVMRSNGTITRSDGTTETFTAPQIPTLNGTTVIDVDTAVKPTEMYTKYKSSK